MNQNLLCEMRTYTNEFDTHTHGYNQLIIPMQGELNIKTASHELSLKEDHIFLLPPDCKHDFYANQSNQFVVVDVPQSLVGLKSSGYGVYQKIDENWSALRTLLANEAEKSIGKKNIHHLVKYAWALIDHETLPQSITYIHNHLHEKLTLASLAAIEHFNVSYYCEWFAKMTGMTPNAYIQKMRIEKAKEYLSETETALIEISLMLGYENQSSLTRVFQKHVGMSPSAYRKLSRDKSYDKTMLEIGKRI